MTSLAITARVHGCPTVTTRVYGRVNGPWALVVCTEQPHPRAAKSIANTTRVHGYVVWTGAREHGP